MQRFILRYRKPVPCDDLKAWEEVMQKKSILDYDENRRGIVVTRFLGMEHPDPKTRLPSLFVTEVYDSHESLSSRYYTQSYGKALSNHDHAIMNALDLLPAR